MNRKKIGALSFFILLWMVLLFSACSRDADEKEAGKAAETGRAADQEALKTEESKPRVQAEKQKAADQKVKAMAIQDSKKANGPPKEIGREEHFIAYNDGTVLDSKTQLMWASKSSVTMSWSNARTYAENYRSGGYTNWRMPTQSELESLYDPWLKSPRGYLLTKYIDIQGCCPWTSDKKPKDTEDLYRVVFDFANGLPYFGTKINDTKSPALPVRSTKQ
jgi:hypothetical protein